MAQRSLSCYFSSLMDAPEHTNDSHSNTTATLEVPVIFTPKAIAVAHKLKELPQYKNKPLRIYLCGKDCDGFMYGVNFDEPLPDDFAWEQESIPLIIDSATRDVCVGSTVDFVDDERGQGFLLTNPKQSRYNGKFWKKGGDPDHEHEHSQTNEPKRKPCGCGRTKTPPHCDGSHSKPL